MFKDVDKTRLMVQGAYRKLKSYYYYNKFFLVMRKKIADFESNPETMSDTFDKLTFSLCHPIKSREYINDLIEKIDFYVIIVLKKLKEIQCF